MPRYILIDNNSGYIWGDSADFAAHIQSDLEPIEAARTLDASLGATGAYWETNSTDPHTCYHVYRADVAGSEAVPVISDGQDQEMIDAVERDCKYITSIARRSVL
jgi:hypothetical protein